jgi:alkanesulfonate monooxygenase SsuD/methylene tetrahydromethanopterin reductase-like flavin-dependent oxidoreductase (luciferase family)
VTENPKYDDENAEWADLTKSDFRTWANPGEFEHRASVDDVFRNDKPALLLGTGITVVVEGTAEEWLALAGEILQRFRPELFPKVTAWHQDRVRLSEQEESGDYPAADHWYGSDDEAVDLLNSIVGAIANDTFIDPPEGGAP